MRLIIVVFFLWFSFIGLTQAPVQADVASLVLPDDRVVAWNPGIPGGIPNVPNVTNVRNFGAVGDGVRDDTNAFRNAIAATPANSALFIPAGTYRITDQLQIRESIVLRGAGPDQTFLKFNLGGRALQSIRVLPRVGINSSYFNLTGGYTRGSRIVQVTNASAFSPGDLVELLQSNDAAVMYTSPQWNQAWAANSVGQVLVVQSVTGNLVEFTEPLMLTYKASLNPRMRRIANVRNVGIESLYIERVDKGNASQITFAQCMYCWVRGIESNLIMRYHIDYSLSYRGEVRDSYIHHAHGYGGGGQGYGIVVQGRTTHTLVENNVLHDLRHSMMVKTGASGNVFGYNYSYNPRSSNGTPTDISLHGHYPNYNLFEGNIVAFIHSGDFWGPSGPGNTFLRNQVTGAGGRLPSIAVSDQSHRQNIIGNTILGGSIPIQAGVLDTLIHGNILTLGGGNPAEIADIPVSFYHSSPPAFYGALPFPSIGADIPSGTIPAASPQSIVYICD